MIETCKYVIACTSSISGETFYHLDVVGLTLDRNKAVPLDKLEADRAFAYNAKEDHPLKTWVVKEGNDG
jgi:hypothetical protein